MLESLRDGAFLVRKSTEANSEYTYTIAIKYVSSKLYIHADYIRLISQYTTFFIRWMSRCFHLRVYTRVEGLSVTLDNNHTFCTMEVYMPPCISHSTGSQLFACMSTCALSMHAQELIRHFEEHSLGIYFPSINTILRYPYQEEQHNSQSKQFNVLPMNFICMHCK